MRVVSCMVYVCMVRYSQNFISVFISLLLCGSVFSHNLGLDLYICNTVNYANYRKDEIL